MKTYLLVIALFLIACTAYGRDVLTRDNDRTKVPGLAPNATKSVFLTVNKQTVDMSEDIAYEVYTPTACKFRVMSTATVKGTTHTLAANERNIRNVNIKSPFLNFTGCTSGEILRH
jgi:hypothetical protein